MYLRLEPEGPTCLSCTMKKTCNSDSGFVFLVPKCKIGEKGKMKNSRTGN